MGTEIQVGLVTDENGMLVSDPLPLGTYELVETRAPEGYILDPKRIMFTIGVVEEDDEPMEFIIGNSPTPGAVELTKVGGDGDVLEGAVFQLLDAEGNIVYSELTTDDTGKIYVDNLNPGIYQFIEMEAPFGYMLDPTPLEFEIVFNQQEPLTLTMENSFIPSAIELTKFGEDGRLLEGVVFELQDSGETLREGLVTDAEGKLVIDDLTPGSYQLVETETLPGYVLDPTPIEFEIGLGETERTEVQFVNPLVTGPVELIKVGEGGDVLEGAVFELRDSAGNVLLTDLMTDADGRLVVEDLLPGIYQFIEVEAPFGYVLDDTPLEFEIVFNPQEMLTLTMENMFQITEPGPEPEPTPEPDPEPESVEKDMVEESTEEVSDTEHQLPKTATNTFNIMMTGMILLGIGGLLIFFSRRKTQS